MAAEGAADGAFHGQVSVYLTEGWQKFVCKRLDSTFASHPRPTPHPPCTRSFEFRSGARTPDHPRSLFEGTAAALCLWSDMLDPQAALGFPVFE